MRVVVQRVSEASVDVAGETVGKIGRGLVVLAGVAHGDTEKDVDYIANKIVGLRVFADPDDKMNLSLNDIGGEVLVVSQFTLLGDVRKGRRPSFVGAAEPEVGKRLYEALVATLTAMGAAKVATGIFQADMKVSLINDGPVTILLDSQKSF